MWFYLLIFRLIGKYTSGLHLIGSKMPGGFNVSAIKSRLSKIWGIGTAHADGILLGAPMEPAKCLGSEAESKTWIDSVAAVYAGISLVWGRWCWKL